MTGNRLTIEDYAGVVLVTFNESTILDSFVIDEMARVLYQLPDEKKKSRIVLNFSNVRSLSSSALGVLVNLNKKVAAIKGSLALCGIAAEIRKIFVITQLEKDFTFYDSEQSAMRAFNVRLD